MCTYTSGKHTKNDGKIHHFQWVNPLFQWPISTHRHRHGADLAAEARLLQRGPRRGVRLAAGEWEIPGPGWERWGVPPGLALSERNGEWDFHHRILEIFMRFSRDFNEILMGLMWLKHTSNGLSTTVYIVDIRIYHSYSHGGYTINVDKTMS